MDFQQYFKLTYTPLQKYILYKQNYILKAGMRYIIVKFSKTNEIYKIRDIFLFILMLR